MTRERTKELLPVIQAWADGKDIQVIGRSEMTNPNPNWETYRPNDPGACPDFSNKNWVWRVKPKPREWRMCVGNDGNLYQNAQVYEPILVREVL